MKAVSYNYDGYGKMINYTQHATENEFDPAQAAGEGLTREELLAMMDKANKAAEKK